MKERVSNTLRFNFYPCYERFCRKCIDGSCTDKETYEKCDFGADKVAERAKKRAMERKNQAAAATVSGLTAKRETECSSVTRSKGK